MLKTLIKEKREAAGKAIKAAQDIGKQMREKPDEAAGLQESFDKAHKDATDLLKEVERLERELELEKAAAFMAQPGPEQKMSHRSPGEPSSKTTEKQEAHKAAFMAYIRFGEGAAKERLAEFSPQEIHALLGTQADLGGFLVPDDFREKVIERRAQVAIIRSAATVEQTSRSALVFPSVQGSGSIYPSGYTGAWKPEGYVTGGTAPPVQNQPKFGQERVPVHVWSPDAIEVSTELIEDSAASLDSILARVIAKTLSLDEDAAFTNGNGVGRPRGLMQSGIAVINSGDANLVKYNGLVDLYSTLPSQYRQNARWLMASLTFGAVLKLADSQARPIFTPNELPGTLWGKPILFSEFMPAVAANNEPILFGDFTEYVIADRHDLRIQRLTERFAPNIGVLPRARMGGQCVNTDAFRTQKIAA